MKKAYSESELKDKAAETFEQFPTVNTVHATVDGNVFLDANRARLHAGVEGRVLPFDRPVEAKEATGDKQPKEYPLNSTNTVKAIKAKQTLEELEQFKDDERKTVIDALEKRKNEILESLSVNAETVTGTNPDTDKETNNAPEGGENPQA